MRFSLGTFVLFILFISSVYAVVMLNEPWYLAESRTIHTRDSFDWGTITSPDMSRRLAAIQTCRNDGLYSPAFDSVGIFEEKGEKNGRLLCTLPSESTQFVRFRSNSEIWLCDSCDYDQEISERDREDTPYTSKIRIFKRRYPETTMGFITRPEILIALTTLALLIYRLLRFRSKNKQSSVQKSGAILP